jgi:hypothetical protein
MRSRSLCIASALAIISATQAFAQCEDKSQQNAADEAGVKGDLAAASKCATSSDKARSEKKLEDAAVKAQKGSAPHGRDQPPPVPSTR